MTAFKSRPCKTVPARVNSTWIARRSFAPRRRFVFLFVRFFFWRRGAPWAYYGYRRPDARDILAERYARGEITHDEYRERLGHLEP